MDKYDLAIEAIKSGKMSLRNAYFNACSHPDKPGPELFVFATPTGDSYYNRRYYGCLVMIRSCDVDQAFTPELTEAIRADERIPKTVGALRKKHLPIFAEWQRRIDKELKREV